MPNPAYPTYYIRHTSMSVDDSVIEELFNSRRIAIHYPDTRRGREKTDNDSLNPNDYDGRASGAVRRLCLIAKEGGYICASYRTRRNECLVGFVPPESRVTLLKRRWCDDPNRIAVLKTLQLQRFRQVDSTKHVVIAVGRPRQGTIMHWKSAGSAVANIIEGKRAASGLGDLSPARQETMCAEFLRLSVAAKLGLPKLRFLVLPVGRTMMDVDIAGIAEDSKPLFAQVTFNESGDVGDKRARLRAVASKEAGHAILFCRCGQISQRNHVTEVPLQMVFDAFASDKNLKQFLT